MGGRWRKGRDCGVGDFEVGNIGLKVKKLVGIIRLP